MAVVTFLGVLAVVGLICAGILWLTQNVRIGGQDKED